MGEDGRPQWVLWRFIVNYSCRHLSFSRVAVSQSGSSKITCGSALGPACRAGGQCLTGRLKLAKMKKAYARLQCRHALPAFGLGTKIGPPR